MLGPGRHGLATPFLAFVSILTACSDDGTRPDEPELARIQGTVILEGFGPLPDAIVRVRRVGHETVFVPTDEQGIFSLEVKSDVWEVSVVGTDGFSASDSATLFVPPDETTTFGPFLVERLVHDVEIRNGVAIPELLFVGAHALVRWTNSDPEPHDIQFQPSIPGTMFGEPWSPSLAQNEQFEWPFESQASATSLNYRCSLHPDDRSGWVLVEG